MQQIYKMQNKSFFKSLSIFVMMFLLGLFSIFVVGDEPKMFYGGIFLLCVSTYCIYLIFSLRGKIALEVKPEEIIIFEKVHIRWEQIQGFTLSYVRSRSASIEMLAIDIKDTDQLLGLSYWQRFSAITNRNTGFKEFMISSQFISEDLNELQQNLNHLLKIDSSSRAEFLQEYKY